MLVGEQLHGLIGGALVALAPTGQIGFVQTNVFHRHAKRLFQGGVKPFVPFLPVQGRIGDRFARAPVFSHKRAIGSNEVGPIDALVVVVGQVSGQRLGAFGLQGGLGLRKLVKRFEEIRTAFPTLGA